MWRISNYEGAAATVETFPRRRRRKPDAHLLIFSGSRRFFRPVNRGQTATSAAGALPRGRRSNRTPLAAAARPSYRIRRVSNNEVVRVDVESTTAVYPARLLLEYRASCVNSPVAVAGAAAAATWKDRGGLDGISLRSDRLHHFDLSSICGAACCTTNPRRTGSKSK